MLYILKIKALISSHVPFSSIKFYTNNTKYMYMDMQFMNKKLKSKQISVDLTKLSHKPVVKFHIVPVHLNFRSYLIVPLTYKYIGLFKHLKCMKVWTFVDLFFFNRIQLYSFIIGKYVVGPFEKENNNNLNSQKCIFHSCQHVCVKIPNCSVGHY